MKSLIEQAIVHKRDIERPKTPIGLAKILIIGAGGAGNNTVDRMMKIGIRGAECIAVNTDQQHLEFIKAHKKVLIGEKITRGLGAGGHPEVGAAAAEESRALLKAEIDGSDLVFITCGEGGGTGSGSAPIIGEIAKSTGAIVVGVVTLPFKSEGIRVEKAKEAIRSLRENVDTLVVIDNNKLLEIAPDLPIEDAFSIADEILATMVKGITETIALPSLINLDYADVRTALCSGGVTIVGIGESDDPQNKAQKAINDAFSSPLLEVDITGAKGALIHVTGGRSMTLREVTAVTDIVKQKMDPNAMVIWGARVDPKLDGTLRVMMLITGVKSPQMLGPVESKFVGTTNGSLVNKRVSLLDVDNLPKFQD
nr:cell division protein FtsZ [Candidatus Sigynarchaeum springense]